MGFITQVYGSNVVLSPVSKSVHQIGFLASSDKMQVVIQYPHQHKDMQGSGVEAV